MEQDDLAMVSDLIQEYEPVSIVFLKDLFHSEMNNDWEGWFYDAHCTKQSAWFPFVEIMTF